MVVSGEPFLNIGSNTVETPEHAGADEELLTDSSEGPSSGWAWAGLGLIVVAVIAAYSPAVHGEYLWDDSNYVCLSPATPVGQLIHARNGLKGIWLSRRAQDYWPLTNSAFWVQWRLWGMDPAGYHLANILLHALGAVMVWRVLERLKVPWAWLGAALFAIHPVAVASVAWISELKNCLSLPLYAAAVLAWLHFEDSRRRGWYVLALGAFGLALAGKTSGVMLPLVLLGLAWWRRGRVAWADLLRAAPFFLLSAVMGLATLWFQHADAAAQTAGMSTSPASRLAASGWVAWFYLYKALLPVGLAMIYPRWEVEASSPWAWGPLAALAGACAVAWGYRKGWGRPVVAALGYSLIMLAPVLGLANMSFHRHSLVSDHFAYLALPGMTALAAGVLGTLARRVGWRPVAAGAGAVLLAGLAALSWQRAGVFATNEALWRDCLAKNPRAVGAHNALGIILSDQGKFDEAIEHYRQAVRIQPDWAEVHNNWGLALRSLKHFKEAAAHYQEAVRIYPHYAAAQSNWGDAMADMDDLEERKPCGSSPTSAAPTTVGVSPWPEKAATPRPSNSSARPLSGCPTPPRPARISLRRRGPWSKAATRPSPEAPAGARQWGLSRFGA
ncbi:MAG: tetratricopeptide repeat protein [Planctomycetota bacterium]|nr:tetratricopeptide repeat protein [Planctomycetota bacterium]